MERSAISVSELLVGLFPQLPRTGSKAEDPWTRKDTVFLQKSCTVGLSFLPPALLCFPKKDSSGS